MHLNQLIAPYKLTIQEHQKLDGYASVNYRIKCNDLNYLLKYYSNPEEFTLIHQEEEILNLLAKEKFSFQIPHSIYSMHKYENNAFSRILPFIEGNLLSTCKPSNQLLSNFGNATGLMNKHLLDIKNDAIQARKLFWDMKHSLLNLEKLRFISNPHDKKIADYYFDLFEHHVLPVQDGLRWNLIHSDLNDNNIIVEGDTIKGIIDFGDITYSPLIYEVAIALTYILLANEENPFEKAKAFIKGYHDILPLEKKEIELLYLLIPARLCVSVVNSAKEKADGADTEYITISEKPAWKLLHKWISINPIWITDFFLKALNFSTETIDMETLKIQRENTSGKSLSTSYNQPIYMTGGAFQYMYDHLGNTYLDAYNNIPHIGHCHPGISKVISKQVRKLNTNTRYLYPEIASYAKALQNKFPESLSKTFFVNSGSAASDVAIRMARTHTNRETIAILENGYHGNTILGIAISDYKHNGKGGNGTPSNIVTLPLPKTYNGKFKHAQQYVDQAIKTLKAEIDTGNTPAALIVEPISGCGGQVPLADNYLKFLKPFLDQHHILLIVDEVQTGFGRLGSHFWGFQMQDVIPDIVILGKPMGNGHPIAAVQTSVAISDSFANGMEFFTSFGGNPVSCAVAHKVLDIVEDENLQLNAKNIGRLLKQGLEALKIKYACIADVRGEGLFIGLEFIDEFGKPSEIIATSIKEGLKNNFILVGTDGPLNNVIKIKPPLCFNTENAQLFLSVLESVIKRAAIT